MTTLIVVSFFASYTLLLCLLITGWNKASLPAIGRHDGHDAGRSEISVIIAARNESLHLPQLVQDLREQKAGNFEVIVIDDHSVDDTAAAGHRAARDDPRFRILPAMGQGKKSALSQAVGLAKGTLVMATDADCRVGPDWIASMARPFEDPAVMFCSGVVATTGDHFFDRVQSLEFAALVGTGAATVAWGRPTMCNGANLAYRKAAFAAVGGYAGNEAIASGDDEFLMHKIQQRFPGSVRCCTSHDALVTTRPAPTFQSFVAQRLRWAGKWSANTSVLSRLLAVYILCFHLCVIALPFAVFTANVPLFVGAICFTVKALIEASLLWSLRPVIRTRKSGLAFFVLQASYSYYVVIIGVLSQFYSVDWKGRRLKAVATDTA